ncbi:hypothetical protein B0H10DRAFT_1939970 [Mycena sp. CBHHK59/15]|nr:hypothetical protein B0H10DRAFT_1939970 [Mycena sp. CBHHK59/15]
MERRPAAQVVEVCVCVRVGPIKALCLALKTTGNRNDELNGSDEGWERERQGTNLRAGTQIQSRRILIYMSGSRNKRVNVSWTHGKRRVWSYLDRMDSVIGYSVYGHSETPVPEEWACWQCANGNHKAWRWTGMSTGWWGGHSGGNRRAGGQAVANLPLHMPFIFGTPPTPHHTALHPVPSSSSSGSSFSSNSALAAAAVLYECGGWGQERGLAGNEGKELARDGTTMTMARARTSASLRCAELQAMVKIPNLAITISGGKKELATYLPFMALASSNWRKAVQYLFSPNQTLY